MPARALLVIALVLALTAAGAITGLVRLGDDRTDGRATAQETPASRPSDTLSADLLTWLRASLPRNAAVLADTTAARSLQDAGFTAVTPARAAGTRVRFVLDRTALSSSAARYPAAATALRGSLPVAVVGSGSSRIVVRQVSTASTADLAADARTRRSAEQQLLANSAVRADGEVADVLRAGDLDLRAATVLALLASDGPMQIVDVEVVPAERAAGLPARAVVVRTAVSDLRDRLSSVGSEYRLAAVTPLADNSYRLTWPLDVTPVARLR